MVQFLPCGEHEDGEEFMVKLDDLLTLQDVGIEEADLAMRRMQIDKEYVLSLVVSDPREWPPLGITNTDRGPLMYDGRHRKEALIDKGLSEFRARCKQFKNEEEVLEAAFEENLRHGLRLTQQNRSDYVYILYKHHPEMTQTELGARAHVSQSTVSEAIDRRRKREQELAQAAAQAATQTASSFETHPATPAPATEGKQEEKKAAPAAGRLLETEEDKQRRKLQETTRSMAREASRLVTYMKPLDDTERRRLIIEWLAPETFQEREALLSFAHLIEEVLEEQPKRKPPRKGQSHLV